MLKLASNPRNICELDEFVEAILGKYYIDPALLPKILISLTEAVNNAIIHGNTCDETKQVVIRHIRKGPFIGFQISDEGRGFDPKKIPDPTRPENIEKCGGRGVYLMKNLADKLVYNVKQRSVEIYFKMQ
ncbi:MAG: ATP-binding protein [Saprospiraceae bacterium]